MTRSERVVTNLNHFLGNHPFLNSDQVDQYYSGPEDSRPIFGSRFDDASFRKGAIEWQPSPFSRWSLEVATQQIKKADLSGGENVIGYLQDQYRRNDSTVSVNPHLPRTYDRVSRRF
jgi:hypothetical protein